jgi:hypothetical protein
MSAHYLRICPHIMLSNAEHPSPGNSPHFPGLQSSPRLLQASRSVRLPVFHITAPAAKAESPSGGISYKRHSPNPSRCFELEARSPSPLHPLPHRSALRSKRLGGVLRTAALSSFPPVPLAATRIGWSVRRAPAHPSGQQAHREPSTKSLSCSESLTGFADWQYPSQRPLPTRAFSKKNRRKPKRMGGEAGFGFRRGLVRGVVLSAVSLGGEEARGNRNNLSLFRPLRYSVNACEDSRRAMAFGIVTPAFTSLA